MDTIVISAVNLVEGGPLSILRNCLSSIGDLNKQYKIIVLVHNQKLVNDIRGGYEYIEIPRAKKSWIKRVYYEYFYFNILSKKLNPTLWLSLHDITPNVKAKRRVVYCHNASPFYKAKLSAILDDPKFTAFTYFYKYLYRLNIKSNDFIIVQQDWLRQSFSQMYGINQKKIIVARPSNEIGFKIKPIENVATKETYIYPAFPRSFKNFEYICEAMKNINNGAVEVLLTISGQENKYSNKVYEKYKNVKGIKFIGLQPQKRIFELYNEVDGLIFPSKLETWGLPLSEFSLTEKKIFAADLPYAREVLNNYPKVAYFNPFRPQELSKLLLTKESEINFECNPKIIQEPKTENWKELFKMLLK